MNRDSVQFRRSYLWYTYWYRNMSIGKSRTGCAQYIACQLKNGSLPGSSTTLQKHTSRTCLISKPIKKQASVFLRYARELDEGCMGESDDDESDDKVITCNDSIENDGCADTVVYSSRDAPSCSVADGGKKWRKASGLIIEYSGRNTMRT